ncbi:AbrB family transcriptional regulator [Paracoccus aerius]
MAAGAAFRQQAQTVLIGIVGVGLFLVLHLPLPFLFGPMMASLVAALMGVRLAGLGQISVAARSVLGVAIGASVTPALVAQLPSMLASVAIIPSTSRPSAWSACRSSAASAGSTW